MTLLRSFIQGRLMTANESTIVGWIAHKRFVPHPCLRITVDGVTHNIESEPVGPLYDIQHSPRWKIQWFRFDPNLLNLEGGEILSIKCNNLECLIAGSPRIFLSRASKLRSTMVFMHIPKTAGTSLRSALHSVFGEENVWPSSKELRAALGQYPQPQFLDDCLLGHPSPIRLLSGHYRLPLLESIFDRPRIFTMFRDPVERSISHLKHEARAAGRSMVTHESLVTDSGDLRHDLLDIQTRYLFTDSEYLDLRRFLSVGESGKVRKLIRSKLERLVLFGAVSNFEVFTKSLGEVIGVSLDYPKKLNTAESRGQVTVSHEALELIQNNSQLDTFCYEEALLIHEPS